MRIHQFSTVLGAIVCLAMTGTLSAETKVQAETKAEPTHPLLANGKPDLSGVWLNDEYGFVNPIIDKDDTIICIVGYELVHAKKAIARGEKPVKPKRPKPDRPVYKEDFQAKVADLDKRQAELDPALRCENPGLPRIGPPDAIVQRPDHVVFLYED